MDTFSVLWIQSRQALRQALEVGQLPPPPEGWKIDLFVSSGGIPEWGVAAYTAVLLDFSTGAWPLEHAVQQLRSAAPASIVVVYDPYHSAGRGYAGVDAHVSSAAAIFPRIAQAIESRPTGPLTISAQSVSQVDDPARQDWQRLLVGESHSMRQVGYLIGMVGSRRATVLITGETGTGKEVAARALHLAGPRRSHPLVSINCGALPENLLEAELFGHVRGAFTGAIQNRMGRFEAGPRRHSVSGRDRRDAAGSAGQAAAGAPGTGNPAAGQLRNHPSRCPGGGRHQLRSGQRIEEGRFREDLYYRLNVVPIHMPPLRARREDIPALAAHFARKICAAERIPLKSLTRTRPRPPAYLHLARQRAPTGERRGDGHRRSAASDSCWMPGDFPLPRDAPADGRCQRLFRWSPCRTEAWITSAPWRSSSGASSNRRSKRPAATRKPPPQMLRLKRTTLSAKVRSLDSLAACN